MSAALPQEQVSHALQQCYLQQTRWSSIEPKSAAQIDVCRHTFTTIPSASHGSSFLPVLAGTLAAARIALCFSFILSISINCSSLLFGLLATGSDCDCGMALQQIAPCWCIFAAMAGASIRHTTTKRIRIGTIKSAAASQHAHDTGNVHC